MRAGRTLQTHAKARTHPPAAADRELQFPNVEAWLVEWLLPMWTRDTGGNTVTWCPQWWRHPEAVARLTALWLAWEHLRQEPALGMSQWWRDHADHHLSILTSTHGPFKGCKPERHAEHPLSRLPVSPAPYGTFTS